MSIVSSAVYEKLLTEMPVKEIFSTEDHFILTLRGCEGLRLFIAKNASLQKGLYIYCGDVFFKAIRSQVQMSRIVHNLETDLPECLFVDFDELHFSGFICQFLKLLPVKR